MNREDKKEYTAFVNNMKKLLRKGALVKVTGLNEEDQAFFDASLIEPADGAYCD